MLSAKRDVLVRVLLRLSVQPADVDDILQESLMRVLLADEKKQIKFPKSYLYMVSRNIVFEESERRSREVRWEIDEAILEADAARIDEAVHNVAHDEQRRFQFCAADGMIRAVGRRFAVRVETREDAQRQTLTARSGPSR